MSISYISPCLTPILVLEAEMFTSHALWVKLLCTLNVFLDLKVFSQRPQGSETPCRWLASMWSLIPTHWPSFPQTLQMFTLWSCFPTNIFLSIFSIIDFTVSSSSWMYSEFSFKSVIFLRSPLGLELFGLEHLFLHQLQCYHHV